jgi:hypothetical protein
MLSLGEFVQRHASNRYQQRDHFQQAYDKEGISGIKKA